MHLYFMGICGVAMGNAALMLRELGHEVCGADTGAYPPMSELLADSGVRVYEGYDAARLQSLAPDLVVVGNALSRGNDEIEWMLESRRFPITSMAALLGDVVLSDRTNIVVTGTHGKTTTAAIAAVLLRANGVASGHFIGGVPKDLPGGASIGRTDAPFVIEGDEYDTAFFDKRSKFIHYRPHVVAINNLEFDHGDIFRDLRDVQRSFDHLLRLVPRHGCIVVNGDDENIEALLPVPWAKTVRIGLGESNDVRLHGFAEDADGSGFDLYWKGERWFGVRWQLHGLYNARNAAMAAAATALTLHPNSPMRLDLSTLGEIQGVKRRQEAIYSDHRVVAIEDFAHHPTSLSAVLLSLRARFPETRLVACFEPRSNTARMNVFQESFKEALGAADAVFLGPVNRADGVPPETRLNPARLAAELSCPGRTAEWFNSNSELLNSVVSDCRQWTSSRQVIVFFSNGSFGGIIAGFPEAWCRGRE